MEECKHCGKRYPNSITYDVVIRELRNFEAEVNTETHPLCESCWKKVKAFVGTDAT